jgi:hypothetical protein
MKKLLSLILVLILLLTSLSSCFARYKENRWFPDEILEECLAPELPNLGDEFTVMEANADIYSCLSSAEYNSYVSAVYEYLKAQSFKYLGTRGEQKGLSQAHSPLIISSLQASSKNFTPTVITDLYILTA